jgi:murein DD-endopeptidase MepM/ murein hydrolase activator NlpD
MNAELPIKLRRTAVRGIAALALATPAVAIAAPTAVDPAGDAVPGLDTGPRAGEIEKRITDPLIEAAKVARAEKRAAAGPFHPVALPSVDYGSVEAAFGNARGRPHEGQDIFAPAGTPVVAPADGEVLDGGADGGRGNWVAIYDPKRKLTYNYFHMVEPAEVATGSKVKAGEQVGRVGCTGSCYGDHLHFEVREGADPYATAIDPLPLLEGWKPVKD